MDPCEFCKIVDREAPAEIVHESDTVLAFRDTNPQAPTHILLIPKEHVPPVREMGKEQGATLVELIRAAAHLAKAAGVDQPGRRLVAQAGGEPGPTRHPL